MNDIPTSPRTLADRMVTMTIEGSPVVHVAGPGASMFRDSVTACGIESPAHFHDAGTSLPIGEINCQACQTTALATPLEHRVSSGRFKRGTGALKGAGMQYGTSAHCACGESYRYNMAPSAGGTQAVQAWEARHYADVEAASSE